VEEVEAETVFCIFQVLDLWYFAAAAAAVKEAAIQTTVVVAAMEKIIYTEIMG
jgi:hypothetical protein